MDEVDILYDIFMLNVSIVDIEEIVCMILLLFVFSILKRKLIWIDFEQSVFLEEVIKKEKFLFGKFKGCGRGKKEWEIVWEDVVKVVFQYV